MVNYTVLGKPNFKNSVLSIHRSRLLEYFISIIFKNWVSG